MTTKSTLAAIATLAIAAIATGCSKKAETTPQPGTATDLTSSINAAATQVTADAVTPTTLTYGDLSLPATKVQAGYALEGNNDIYVSFEATTIDQYPQTNTYAAAKAIALYNEATDNSIAGGEVTSASDLETYFQNLASLFSIETAPVYAKATLPACNLTLNVTPVYATDAYVTYGVYSSYFNGGNHPATDYALQTIDPTTGKVLSLNDLVKADQIDAMHALIVETIANANGQSVEDYLKTVNEYLGNDAATAVTAATFPVYNAALTADGVVVTYPASSIAPYSDGIKAYTLPTATVSEMLAN